MQILIQLTKLWKKLNKDEVKDKLISLSSLLDCISKLLEENKKQNDALCTKKENICSLLVFAKTIDEAKMFLDQAHIQWRKRFEAEHTDNTYNIDVVSDELKRFNTTVTEARSMLFSILNSGSDRQMFVVQSRLHTQITDHYKRLKALEIWDLTESYIFNPKNLKKLIETIKFENLTPSKRFSDALDRISVSGKSMISDGLPSPKPCLASMELMSAAFHKIFNCRSETRAYFG